MLAFTQNHMPPTVMGCFHHFPPTVSLHDSPGTLSQTRPYLKSETFQSCTQLD